MKKALYNSCAKKKDSSELNLKLRNARNFIKLKKNISEERMRNGVKKILKARNTGTQVRLDSFFKVTSTTPKRKVILQLE